MNSHGSISNLTLCARRDYTQSTTRHSTGSAVPSVVYPDASENVVGSARSWYWPPETGAARVVPVTAVRRRGPPTIEYTSSRNGPLGVGGSLVYVQVMSPLQ